MNLKPAVEETALNIAPVREEAQRSPRLNFASRLYLAAWDSYEKLEGVLHALFTGFWLGVLDRESLHRIDEAYYNQESRYQDEQYNRMGLFAWEMEVVRGYFSGCRTLMLVGAGGGREVLALAQMGFAVDGYECHPRLIATANRLLKEAAVPARVERLVRDACPSGAKIYDGIIVGWGAYMLIRGRGRRVAFLKQLRTRMESEAPLLISFFYREGTPHRLHLTAAIGNALQSLRGRRSEASIEPGDDLAPNFVHHFTQEQIASELAEAGFRLALYSTRGYGHAVGMAVGEKAQEMSSYSSKAGKSAAVEAAAARAGKL